MKEFFKTLGVFLLGCILACMIILSVTMVSFIVDPDSPLVVYEEIYQQGINAARADVPLTGNPHIGPQSTKVWREGWIQESKNMLEELK